MTKLIRSIAPLNLKDYTKLVIKMDTPTSSPSSQAVIHGGYETKDRVNYLFWQCGKARLAGDGHALHRYLSQLYLEACTLCRNKGLEDAKKALNKATNYFNDMCKNNSELRKGAKITPELYNALFELEEELRKQTSSHVMPNREDPGVAINEY